MAIALALLAVTLAPRIVPAEWRPQGPVFVAVFGAWAMAALGVADDRAAVGAKAKLLLGAGIAVVVALLVPPVRAIPLWPGAALPLWAPVGVAGGVLWLVTATNAVNFVDGANGFAPGGLLIAFLALAVGASPSDPQTAWLAALAAAAYLGFLPWNLAGRLFQGDAGSLFGGFLFAALHLAAVGRGALPLLFGPVVMLPWLTDVLLTLLRRARGRRPLLEAHREHLYQRWLQATARAHLALAWRNALVCAAAALAGLATVAAARWQAPIFLAVLAACVAGWTLTSRRLDATLASI
ncbi:MAG: hypothetical protein INR64_02425 [Caulobacteraceae bacterium]|nr:hypothetical protein [Caulobacter sp.]